jgi:multiple sugar transport system permease protein
MAGRDDVADRSLEHGLAAPRAARSSRGHLHRGEGLGAAILVGPYLVLLMVAGIVPTIYAVIQSLQSDAGTGFAGIDNFSTIIGDFRFFTTFQHILITLVVWIPIMMIGVVGLALLVHASPGKLGSSMRIIYYIPGAMAGTANFMLWLFLLNPGQSPLDFLWNGFGYTNLNQVAQPSHLPVILAAMLFFQGAGTWLVIVNGGLNSIPEEVLEAGIVDGAGPVSLAWRIKLPIIRPWLGYMLLLNIAYGFQLFVEPQVMSQATHGLISPQWSPNQLSYTYAYQIMNTPAAAAMSVLLLMISLGLGLLIVSRSGLFAAQD